MHILGLANGSINGNSEILMKAALLAARAKHPSVTTAWIHIPSLSIPAKGAPPKTAQNAELLPDSQTRDVTQHSSSIPDDREAVLQAIMDADALIIATPVWSHQPAGTLKALGDSILGPYADVAGAMRKIKQNPNKSLAELGIGPKVVKPRVAGFIAVAGSNTPFPEQWSQALPTMHLFTYPLHAKVVDQQVFPGNANAAAVLTHPEETVERAKKLGENVVSQIGKSFDEAKYLGPREKGACPYCNLLKLEFREGNHVQCIVCGANGELETDSDGDIRPVWEEDSLASQFTLKGKWKHIDDIGVQLNEEREKLPGIQEERQKWQRVEIPMVKLPSNSQQRSNL
ncbi:hypothetical protein H2203_002820 [Taxawa tesnikishii (nom. ined.)]|nr:hypothetical protein H2203_002820 [Dothideales sp. JES 119]